MLIREFTMEAYIPPASGVLVKRSRFDFESDRDFLVFPKPEPITIIVDISAVEFTGLTIEWNPAKVFSAGSEPDPFIFLDFQKALMGYRLNRLRVDLKEF